MSMVLLICGAAALVVGARRGWQATPLAMPPDGASVWSRGR